MLQLWFERKLPDDCHHLLSDNATIVGTGTDHPEAPFASVSSAAGIVAGAKLKYGPEMMDRATSLRVIARTGIGYDNIDVAAATQRGIAVCNAPDGPTVSTAEHTIALLFTVAKRIQRNTRLLREGARIDFFNANDGIELHGKTLGLVGLGRIGGRVAQLARCMGIVVTAYDPFVSAKRAEELGIQLSSSLAALLESSDFVSLHVPLTADTQHLIDAAAIQRMKKGAILVNSARGGLVDEAALLDALKAGRLSGAGLDVFEKEPPPPDCPLLHRDDVVATPHIAPATLSGKQRLWRIAIDQAMKVLQGRKPEHLVNSDVWEKTKAKVGD
jgi:D-3-phosphoglycerate dehydrogenase